MLKRGVGHGSLKQTRDQIIPIIYEDFNTCVSHDELMVCRWSGTLCGFLLERTRTLPLR